MANGEIYIAQLSTGANINLLPLAAGQLMAGLNAAPDISERHRTEILFRREDPAIVVERMDNPIVLGLSCFLWNTNHSLAIAEAVHRKFPETIIVLGGPSIPKAPGLVEPFFAAYPFVDVVCLEEGEAVFLELCRRAPRREYSDIPGIVHRDRGSGVVTRNPDSCALDMSSLKSPYLDGTFDRIYSSYPAEFSGVILETNRGCPYRCSYCTWGSQNPKIREKPSEMVAAEIEWIGKNGIKYIAMSDANFGIRARDVEFAQLLAECKHKYGVPNFISVSWVKNSSEKVLAIADILQKNGIGFRVTLSLQSLNADALTAANRTNIKRSAYDQIKAAYREDNIYSYTELIFGLPEESYRSYLAGIDSSLAPSVFDQLYIYPLFLFPNTEMSSPESRKKYGIETRSVECVYTKSKIDNKIKENVEIVVGTRAMPTEDWIRAFAVGYSTLALHDDRLAFFVFCYLKREFQLQPTEFAVFMRERADRASHPVLFAAFDLLERRARGVVEDNRDHLIRPRTFGDVPFDPPEGVFLELLLSKDDFYKELFEVTCAFLEQKGCRFEHEVLSDLFKFQSAIMASPEAAPSDVVLAHDWIAYFGYTFNLPEKPLAPRKFRLKVVDVKPSLGSSEQFLKNHFDIRGVPAFNLLYDEAGNLVFPPVTMQHLTPP